LSTATLHESQSASLGYASPVHPAASNHKKAVSFIMFFSSSTRRYIGIIAPLISVAMSAAPGLSAAQSASATSTALTPGTYIAEGGAGSLVLKAGKSGALNFSISTTGDNGHNCSLEGELRAGRAKLEGLDAKTPCLVTMKLTPEGVDVKDASDGACQVHCGMRATFETVFFQPAAACLSGAIGKTRNTFKQRYDEKKFADARALLEPVLNDCKRSLNWLDAARIRNDLAVTLHKLGDLPTCRAVLQPLAEDAAMTDKAIRENYPPLETDLYLPIVRATRTNLKLCK
jgi:hypothetical protein